MAQHHHPEDPLAWVPSTDVDASDPSIEGYQAAIEWLRGRDLDRAGANTFRGVPVTSSNAGWRRINFVYPGRPTVSILIDEVDSYVVAIMPADATWLQFSDRAIPQGVNATVLGFSSSYIRLLDDINSVDIVFGTPVLTNVYHVLSNFNPQLGLRSPEMKRQRRALVQLVVLFCEALRFKHLLARLMEIMASGQSIKLPPHMWDWFRKWSSILKFALDCKHRDSIEEEDDDADLLLNITAFGINNREDVAGFLGLILHTARL